MEVQIKELPSCYFIVRADPLGESKQSLLSAIDSCDYMEEKIDGGSRISKTDYFTDVGGEKPYIDILFDVIHDGFLGFLEKAKCSKVGIESIWFQQYNHGDTHNWHTHHTTNYACVYFVELPASECATELYDPHTGRVIRLDDVEEGDLVIFPTSYLHRSPENNTRGRKTIIAFNCGVSGYNGGIHAED